MAALRGLKKEHMGRGVRGRGEGKRHGPNIYKDTKS
jgi:hypothetical protein